MFLICIKKMSNKSNILSPLIIFSHLILAASTEHGVRLPVPGVARQHLAANVLVKNLDLDLPQHIGHPTALTNDSLQILTNHSNDSNTLLFR